MTKEVMVKNNPLICVSCSGTLLRKQNQFKCQFCKTSFPILNNVPIFIDPKNELFPQNLVMDMTSAGFSSMRFINLSKFIPDYGLDKSKKIFELFIESKAQDCQKCLIIGSGLNIQHNKFLRSHFYTLTITDITLSPEVDYVCDAHRLPFSNNSFDLVMVNAVLEHVFEPSTVVEEISRVLKVDGIVLASTPFLQGVHMGAFDFQRFTDLGHRWLFRKFEEIQRGTVGGSGSSLSWSIAYFLSSFAPNKFSAKLIKALSRVLFSWLKIFDLIDKKGDVDAAVGYYFIGLNKKQNVISQKELTQQYRGQDK